VFIIGLLGAKVKLKDL